MPYTQVKAFNQSKATKEKNMCLQNVRTGYGIAPRYATAWAAWGGTEQHKNRSVPTGVDVPLFYDYTTGGKRYGHINVRLANGKVWNDGKLFSSLSAFEKAWGNVKYVGWGESVNEVRVIKEGDDMYKGKSAKEHYKEKLEWKKRSDAHYKAYIEAKAQSSQTNEFNAIGKALVTLLAKFGYKKV